MDEWERWAVQEVTSGPRVEYARFDLLPQLRYRTPSGRWATLLRLPELGDALQHGFDELLFSFKLPQVISDLKRFLDLEKAGPESEEDRDEYQSLLLELSSELINDSVSVKFDDFIAALRRQISNPRNSASVLWSPRIWAPKEQARQRQLVNDALRPYLTRWTAEGLCLQDLNPSEFEDLVAELLFKAGLKVYKVRESPQGGRDLIARGALIPGEEPLEMAVEVKHRPVVDRPEVQLALYQNRAYPALVFVTSGRFTSGVFKEKLIGENRHRLFLRDGLAVGDMVRLHFGLKPGTGKVIHSDERYRARNQPE